MLDGLDSVEKDMDALLGDSPWLGTAAQRALHEATTAVRTAAEDRVASDQFAKVADTTATLLRDTFGAREA